MLKHSQINTSLQSKSNRTLFQNLEGFTVIGATLDLCHITEITVSGLHLGKTFLLFFLMPCLDTLEPLECSTLGLSPDRPCLLFT